MLDLRDIYGIPYYFSTYLQYFLSPCVVWDACVCLICIYGCYCVWGLLPQCVGRVRETLGVLLTFHLVFRWDFFIKYTRLAGSQSPGLLLSAAFLSPSEHRITDKHHCAWLDSRASGWGPGVCTARALPTESSLQPLVLSKVSQPAQSFYKTQYFWRL